MAGVSAVQVARRYESQRESLEKTSRAIEACESRISDIAAIAEEDPGESSTTTPLDCVVAVVRRAESRCGAEMVCCCSTH